MALTPEFRSQISTLAAGAQEMARLHTRRIENAEETIALQIQNLLQEESSKIPPENQDPIILRRMRGPKMVEYVYNPQDATLRRFMLRNKGGKEIPTEESHIIGPKDWFSIAERIEFEIRERINSLTSGLPLQQ